PFFGSTWSSPGPVTAARGGGCGDSPGGGVATYCATAGTATATRTSIPIPFTVFISIVCTPGAEQLNAPNNRVPRGRPLARAHSQIAAPRAAHYRSHALDRTRFAPLQTDSTHNDREPVGRWIGRFWGR